MDASMFYAKDFVHDWLDDDGGVFKSKRSRTSMGRVKYYFVEYGRFKRSRSASFPLKELKDDVYSLGRTLRQLIEVGFYHLPSDTTYNKL
jgi:hypothetical protein